MPGFPSKSEIDRIGDRIRANGGHIADEDLPTLRVWRSRHEHVVQRALAALGALGHEGTPRVKTLPTMVEKLQREGTRLSQVRDIAGIRVVINEGMAAQDRVAEQIRAAFPDRPRTYDRRTNPSYGYRALHVVVRFDGCLIEIQVRTVLQHLWAEIYERLADAFGREIRYGELPADASGRRIVEQMRHISERIAHLEEADFDEFASVRTEDLDLDVPEERELEAAIREVRAQRDQLRRALERAIEALK